MTEKLTTAEVRLAATTNVDLPLTQYKKLETGFDAWLESVKAEAEARGAAKIVAELKRRESSSSVSASNSAPASVIVKSEPTQSTDGDTPARPAKRKRIRTKKNKPMPVDNHNS